MPLCRDHHDLVDMGETFIVWRNECICQNAHLVDHKLAVEKQLPIYIVFFYSCFQPFDIIAVLKAVLHGYYPCECYEEKAYCALPRLNVHKMYY